jgi:hypothetical protein
MRKQTTIQNPESGTTHQPVALHLDVSVLMIVFSLWNPHQGQIFEPGDGLGLGFGTDQSTTPYVAL